MFWKWLMMGVMLISIPLNAGSVETLDECEARMVSDHYYGVFVKGLALGALTDAHLATAIASETPLDPLAGVRPNTRNFSTKQALAVWAKDPRALKLWPGTRERLKALNEERGRIETIRSDAAHGTRLVLAPQSYLGLDTAYSSVAAVTLDNGEPVLAYFARSEKLGVVNLRDKTSLLNDALPEKAHGAEYRQLAWYRDSIGKLWLYISITNLSGHSEVFKRAWGSTEWEEVKLGLSSKQSAHEMVSPVPGVMLLRVLLNHMEASVVNIANGRLEEVPGVTSLDPGGFLYQDGNLLAPPVRPTWRDRAEIHRGADGHVLRFLAAGSTEGLARWLSLGGFFEVEYHGEWLKVPLPKDSPGDISKALAYSGAPGQELVALAYHSQGHAVVNIWKVGEFSQPLWTFNLETEGVVEMHWFDGRQGEPLLALKTKESAWRLQIYSLRDRELALSFESPGALQNWFEFDGRTYFTVHNGRTLSVMTPLSTTRGE